jgi:HEAT repeat protein
MGALVKIGEPAVPELIDAIETAHDRAASMNYGNVQRSEWSIKHDARILQTRAAMVLGKSGDARAVPVLMKLKGNDCLFFCRDVDEAIKSSQENKKN